MISCTKAERDTERLNRAMGPHRIFRNDNSDTLRHKKRPRCHSLGKGEETIAPIDDT